MALVVSVGKGQQVEVENCKNHSSDEIGGAASDSESIQDDNRSVLDSQSILDKISGAEPDSDSIQHNMDISDTESMQESDIDSNNCQRSRVHHQQGHHDLDKQENLVPSQILIMQSNDTPFSSDELVLDVGVMTMSKIRFLIHCEI